MSRIPDCPRSAHFGWAAYVVRCDACSRHGVQKEQGALPFISWTQPGVHPFIGLSSHPHNLRPFGGNATFWETPVWLKYGHGYAVTYICVWCLFSVGRYPSDPNVSLLPSGRRPTFSSRGARCVALQEAPFSCVWTWGAPVPGILANCQLNGEYNIIQRLIMVKLASQWMRCILGPTHLLQRFKPWGSPMKQLSLLHMLWWQHSRQKPWSHLAATQRIAGKPRRLRHSNETGPATYLWIGFQEDHKKVLVSIPGYILYILQLYSAQIFLFSSGKTWQNHGGSTMRNFSGRHLAPWRVPNSAAVEAPTSTDHNELLRRPLHLIWNPMYENIWEPGGICVRLFICTSICMYIYICVCVCDKRYIYNIIYIICIQ
jgi:hypothetical protein